MATAPPCSERCAGRQPRARSASVAVTGPPCAGPRRRGWTRCPRSSCAVAACRPTRLCAGPAATRTCSASRRGNAVGALEDLIETGLRSTARCCGRCRHRRANSVRVCSPASRRVASLRPRSAGLPALTPAPRTLDQTGSCRRCPPIHPLHVVVDVLSRTTLFSVTVDKRRQVQPDLGQDDLSGPHTDAVDAGQVYAGPAVQLRARVVVPMNAALRRSWRESMAPGANEKSFVTRLPHCCRPADSGRPFPPQRVCQRSVTVVLERDPRRRRHDLQRRLPGGRRTRGRGQKLPGDGEARRSRASGRPGDGRERRSPPRGAG